MLGFGAMLMSGTARVTADPYYDMVVLNASFDGTNGDTVFVDDSNTGGAVTITGSPYLDTTSPAVGVASALFNGSTDWVSYADRPGFTIGSNDFTIRARIKLSSTAGINIISAQYQDGVAANCAHIFYFQSNLLHLGLGIGGAVIDVSKAWTPSTGVWYYVQAKRTAGTVDFSVDGTSLGTASNAGSVQDSSQTIQIGAGSSNSAYAFHGNISDYRFYNGVALTNTVPTGLQGLNSTDDTNWKYCVLACPFQNTLKDMSGQYGTGSGSVALSSTRSKFGTTSASFNGSSQYITYPNSAASFGLPGDFTVEFFVYFVATAAGGYIYDGRTSSGSAAGFAIYIDTSGVPHVLSNSADQITGVALTTGAWYHFAATRNGASFKLFVAGVQIGSTWVTSANFSDGNCVIGRNNPGAATYLNGNVANLRITNGYSRYNSTFTPPIAAFFKSKDETTDPFWSSVKLALHCDGTNGGTTLTDSSDAAHTMTANGTATTSTSVKVYGTASASVPATGSGYFSSADSADWNFTGDFNLDFFMRTGSQPGSGVYYAQVSQYNSTGNQCSWSLAYRNSAGTKKLSFDWSTNGSTTGTTLEANYTLVTDAWYHVRVCRAGSTAYLYVSGVLVGTVTMSGALFDSSASLTLSGINAATSLADGYLDEIVITKGICRTPGMNFTPPTRAFATSS